MCSTYCADTLKAGEPVGIEHASANDPSLQSDEKYKALKLIWERWLWPVG